LGFLAINSGVMRMLQWFKRNATSVPREQLVEAKHQTLPSEEKLERLVDRLGADAGSANETLPSEERIERLVDRLGTDAGSANERAAASTPMHVIVVASQKGGVGKTTIAAHLAVQASMAGQGPAVLVDTDPQGSLSEWWDARKDEYQRNEDELALVTVKLDDLPTRLAELRRNGAAVAIIDTPPAITASINRVIEIADFVVIPARPSPHDLRAIAATVSLAQGAGKPFLFVVNGATHRANITAQAVAALSDHGQVAPVILYQRTDFAASMIDGRTVMETTAAGRSAQEMAELWECVSAQTSTGQ
jgi:chromosome partitioning protein